MYVQGSDSLKAFDVEVSLPIWGLCYIQLGYGCPLFKWLSILLVIGPP